MRCDEFETLLNELLDERASPRDNRKLLHHAQDCVACMELLQGHETLLAGVRTMPTVRLRQAEREVGLSLAERVALEFRTNALSKGANTPSAYENSVELARAGAVATATNHRMTLAIVGTALTAAAAILIAFLPNGASAPNVPDRSPPSNIRIVSPSNSADESSVARNDAGKLEAIAWVGYHAADVIAPLTNSMVSALRELKKRPLFRNPDEQLRSSFCPIGDAAESVA